MLRKFEAQARERQAVALRTPVLVVGLLFALVCTAMALLAAQLPREAVGVYIGGVMVALLVLAVGAAGRWQIAAHLLAAGMGAMLVAQAVWPQDGPVFFLTQAMVLVVFAGWALRQRVATFWALTSVALALYFQRTGYLSWLHVCILACGVLVLWWTVWDLRRMALRQVTELMHIAQLLEKQSERLKLLSHAIEQTAESIAIVDFEGRVVYANQAFEQQSGYTKAEALGRYAREISSNGLDPATRAQMRSTVEQGEVWRSVLHNRRKDDAPVIESVSITPVFNDAKQLTHFIECKHDMSAQLAHEQRIAQLQNLDELTQLPNRSALLRGLDASLLQQRLQRSGDVPNHQPWHGLLLVDVDRFSLFNDARGNAWGDQLLQALVQRLHQHLPEGVWMARVMSDRFALVFEHVGSTCMAARREVQRVAMQLQAQLRDLVCEGELVPMSCGMGYTLFTAPDGDEDAGSSHILRRATMALHQAKRQGTGQIYAYTESLTQSAVRKLRVESSLRDALQNGQLQLYVQPQVDSYGRVQAAEALVRWQHPQEGWISPAEFIPVAEEAGLIVQLGDWVLEQVCQLLQAPVVQAGGYSVSANISAIQIMQDDFVPKIERLIARTGIAPHKLLLEVTEGMLLNDVGTAVQKMQALQAQGVQFALDDFGTGYSSLAYVMQLPIQELKLDQSFIRELDSQGVSGALVESVLMVAQRKGIRVVAEGVERVEQAELLHAWDPALWCQGYLYSRPIPAAQWLEDPQAHLQRVSSE